MKSSEYELKVHLAYTELHKSVQKLISFFEKPLNTSRKVYTHWDGKDVLGHLVFWHESFARNLKDLSLGHTPAPLKGKLSEVNLMSIQSTRQESVSVLLKRLQRAQQCIDTHIVNTEIESIPYKKGSRAYTRLEHLEIVSAHIKRHLKDLNLVYKNELPA
ncbi:hypothetical protein [Ascidiimonas aurantiaca]|uniref:hypothetical protein n=1 Tax=Ascidiimonas aurantiaca TaxID=1685432 RepID=UPI0030EC4103